MRDIALGVVSSTFALYLLTFVMVWRIILNGVMGKMGKISDENIIRFNKHLLKKNKFGVSFKF